VKQRKTRYLKRTHKFGIQLPKTIDEALALDQLNGNTLWAAGIAKEMKNVCVAFKILANDESVPIGYQRIPCHMVFDIKMEDFTRKARLVAGGHMTNATSTITYASVVSRETVRIALLMAALNDLEVKAGDVLNAYVTAPVTEKVWTVLGPEFGPVAGKNAIIVRALYGLKSSGAALDFPAKDITPDLDHFDDSELLSPDSADVEIMPEFGDNLLNAKIMLPRGGVLTKGPRYCPEV
jgi:hypothetical protein